MCAFSIHIFSSLFPYYTHTIVQFNLSTIPSIFILLLPSPSVSSLGRFSMHRKSLFYLCVFPVVFFNLIQIFFFFSVWMTILLSYCGTKFQNMKKEVGNICEKTNGESQDEHAKVRWPMGSTPRWCSACYSWGKFNICVVHIKVWLSWCPVRDTERRLQKSGEHFAILAQSIFPPSESFPWRSSSSPYQHWYRGGLVIQFLIVGRGE